MKDKKPKPVENDDRTYFELQEDAWLDNDCQGNIEDYGEDNER